MTHLERGLVHRDSFSLQSCLRDTAWRQVSAIGCSICASGCRRIYISHLAVAMSRPCKPGASHREVLLGAVVTRRRRKESSWEKWTAICREVLLVTRPELQDALLGLQVRLLPQAAL